jgi:type I restriction enzyme S subunit
MWVEKKLDNVCLNITDGKHGDCKNEENSGYYFISSKDVKSGKIHYKNARQITKDDFIDCHRRTKLELNDILITNSGTIGRMAIVNNNPRTSRTTFQKSVAIIKPNSEVVKPKYLYYRISNDLWKFVNTSGGTAQQNLLLKDLRKIKIAVPPLPTQQRIANILSAYDDLIENNNRRIELLEQAAQQIYKEWFVRFRFPGYETANFVKGIPDGWEVKTLSDIANIQMGQSPKSEFYNQNREGLPFHQGVSNFKNRYPVHDTYCTVMKRVADKGDILLSVRAPVGRINIANTKLVIGRGLSSISSKTKNQSHLFYLLINYFHKEDIIGNGSIYSSVGKDELFGVKLLLPPYELIKKFEEISNSIDSQIFRLTAKNENLIKQRDLLLPRLMSGKMEV